MRVATRCAKHKRGGRASLPLPACHKGVYARLRRAMERSEFARLSRKFRVRGPLRESELGGRSSLPPRACPCGCFPHPDPLHSPSKTGVNALMASGEREQRPRPPQVSANEGRPDIGLAWHQGDHKGRPCIGNRATTKGSPLRPNSASTRQHEIDGFWPFALLVGLDIKRDPLPFDERLQSGVLHRGDMHEYVAPAVVRLYEAVSAFTIEELDRAAHCHRENSCPVVARRRPPRRGGRVDIRHSARPPRI